MVQPIASGRKPVLFRNYPDLEDHLNWLDLGLGEAPVHRLKNLPHDNLWVKRDDLTSKEMGGNKVRRLEFILAEAVKQKQSHIITLGGIGSNHCLAVAKHCRKLGLRNTLCLFHQPISKNVLNTLKLFHLNGADIVYSGSMWKAIFDFYLRLKIKYPGACFVASGGASTFGILGAINAAMELKEQVDRGESPEPDYIFCPTASNGGMAGLILGCQLSGLKSRVLGVRTGGARLGPIPLNTPGTITGMMHKSIRFLKGKSNMIPDIKIPIPELIENYCGAGYGYPTESGNRATQLFLEKESIKLEPVYTAKTCAALLNLMNSDRFKNKMLLYWHTYHSLNLSEESSDVNTVELPLEIQYLFKKSNLVVKD